MRTGARVSPSCRRKLLEAGYVEADWISRQSRQSPLRTGRPIRCERGGPYVGIRFLRFDRAANFGRACQHQGGAQNAAHANDRYISICSNKGYCYTW
jgi:hypothetical protein